MAGPITFQTVGRILRLAYQDSGLVQDGDSPDSAQLADGMMRLNDMANLWVTQGVKLWLITDQSIPLVAGTDTYTLGPSGSVNMTRPLQVFEAYYLDSSNNRTPLSILSWTDWARLSQVTTQGALNSILVDKQQTLLSIRTWQVPDTTEATGTLHVLLRNQVTNVTMLTDTIGFPIEWAMALRWGLASDLAMGQPTAIMQRCDQRAETFRMALDEWDADDASVMFSLDGVAYSADFPG